MPEKVESGEWTGFHLRGDPGSSGKASLGKSALEDDLDRSSVRDGFQLALAARFLGPPGPETAAGEFRFGTDETEIRGGGLWRPSQRAAVERPADNPGDPWSKPCKRLPSTG